MSSDISRFLQEWPYDPRRISARKFVGDDGILKIQLRIDLGVLQMNYEGRPDGTKLKNAANWLEHFRKQRKRNKHFVLMPEDVQRLRLEAIQYYHRYLSLYHLHDYPGVMRDTHHNLEILKFISRYGNEEDSWTVQVYRPHVIMMHTSAQALLQLEHNQRTEALATVHLGLKQIKHFYGNVYELDQPEVSPEILALRELQHRITDDSIPEPQAEEENLEENLELAIYSDNFELAARLRDELKRLKNS